MRSLFILFFVLALTVPAVAQQKNLKWLGVFTTDTYPIKWCEIVKVDSIVIYYNSSTIGVKDGSAMDYAESLSPASNQQALSTGLLKSGYNALIGAKLIVSHSFSPVTDLNVING